MQRFSIHFPFISPLFRPNPSTAITMAATAAPSATTTTHHQQQTSAAPTGDGAGFQLPGSYVTLPDGSNFYAATNITFILCVPNSSVGKEKGWRQYSMLF
jgi:hypothetical protein